MQNWSITRGWIWGAMRAQRRWSQNCRWRCGRGGCRSRWMNDDFHILTSLTMAWNAANEIDVAFNIKREPFLASAWGTKRGWGIACLEILLCHSYHIIKFWIEFKHCIHKKKKIKKKYYWWDFVICKTISTIELSSALNKLGDTYRSLQNLRGKSRGESQNFE